MNFIHILNINPLHIINAIVAITLISITSTIIYIALRKSIQKEKNKVKALQKLENHARISKDQMFNNAPIFIEIWNKEYNIIDANDLTWNFWGAKNKQEYLNEYTVSLPSTQASGKNSVAYWQENLQKTFDQGEHRWEIKGKRNDETFHFEIRACKVTQKNEDRVITYAIDVTQLKEALERSLEAQVAKEQAQETSLHKTRFLAKMSHEIRTPLTSIIGVSEVELKNPTHRPSTQEAFSKIFTSGNILLNITNDILDLSKIESGNMPINIDKYSVSSIIGDVIQLQLSHIAKKDLQFFVNIDPNIPKDLIGDQLRLKQIFNNLLSNSIKYTEKGSINLSFGYKQQQDFVDFLVTIEDTGVGMTKDQLDVLGSEYVRFNETKNNIHIAGTGLGISIVKSLLEHMDSNMHIESQVNKGTKIILTIPQTVASYEPIGIETADNLSKFQIDYSHVLQKVNFAPVDMSYGKVLVVDDVESNLFVVRGLLGQYNLQIETVNSGSLAIDKITEGNVYDIIFMDQMMHGLDGIETTKIIRSTGYTHPILAFTADAMYGQVGEYIKNGFDGFVSKPIQNDHLYAILQKYIQQKHETMRTPISASYLDDPTILKEIHQDFLETCQNIIPKIQSNLDSNDLKAAHIQVHTIKGLASLIQEKSLADICDKIETALKKNEIPDTNHLEQLEPELNIVLEKINNYQ